MHERERQPNLVFEDNEKDSDGIPFPDKQPPELEDIIDNPKVEEHENPRTTLSDLREIAIKMQRGEANESAISDVRKKRKHKDQLGIQD